MDSMDHFALLDTYRSLVTSILIPPPFLILDIFVPTKAASSMNLFESERQVVLAN